mmetsp:Transcript_10773/g.21154  ORF Transcript_10773/g.21154 Transcript_10773/m.21154 type:complete len:198 (-) Transcript_10773:233-826(-)
MAPLCRALVLSLLALCALTRVGAECVDNDDAVTEYYCDAKFEKVCLTNDNGTYHHGCLSCEGPILEYDCGTCECQVKTVWLVAFTCIGVASVLMCCGLCCAFCLCCRRARWRLRRAADPSRYQRVQYSQGVVHADAVPVTNPVAAASAASAEVDTSHVPSAPHVPEGYFSSDEDHHHAHYHPPSAPPKSGPLSPESQ